MNIKDINQNGLFTEPEFKTGDRVICCPEECIYRYIKGTVKEVRKLSEFEYEYVIICDDGREFRTKDLFYLYKSEYDHLSHFIFLVLSRLDYDFWNKRSKRRAEVKRY